MVLSPCANYFIMSLIILNAALLGIEIDMSAKVDMGGPVVWKFAFEFVQSVRSVFVSFQSLKK